MAKRARRDILTGGSGDVNPELFRCQLPANNATVTSTQFPLPIQRLNNRGRAMVMELLKVIYTLPSAVSTDAVNEINICLSTSDRGAATVARPTDQGVLDVFRWATTVNTSGAVTLESPCYHDVTDGAGHGLLVGSDSLFVQHSNSGINTTADVTIIYRWKNVGYQEYVGMLQEQQ